jgi:RimJ/RimL family protein N-acetyltransferase
LKEQINLVGNSVVLREYDEADRDFYHSWISDPCIMKYVEFGTSSRLESDKKFDYVLSQQHADQRKDFYLALKLRESGQLIGNAGISVIENELSTAEIGWILKPDFRGNGYATEAGKLLISFGVKTLQVSNIFATCDIQNKKSEAIMQRLGMIRAVNPMSNLGSNTKIRYNISV